MQKHKIQLIIGSTRPNRIGVQIAEWLKNLVEEDSILDVEIIDLKEINLPMYDEPINAQMANYQNEHTKKWSEKVKTAEGYIFLTPEYNAGYPASLKNAIDYLYHEWKGKNTLIVSYGYGAGKSSQKQLKEVLDRIGTINVTPEGELMISQDMFTENFALQDPKVIFASQEEGIKESLISLEKAFIDQKYKA